MKVTSNIVYTHDEYGEILVVDVHHVYDEYELQTGDGELTSRVVRYTDDWDEYGPMPSKVRVISVDEFRTAVGDPVRTIEFTRPTTDREED